MPLKVYKPTSPGRRGMTALRDEELTKKKPEKSLTGFHLRTGGRNNDGRQTIRFRGGGHKRLYRQIDFRRDRYAPTVVKRCEASSAAQVVAASVEVLR